MKRGFWGFAALAALFMVPELDAQCGPGGPGGGGPIIRPIPSRPLTPGRPLRPISPRPGGPTRPTTPVDTTPNTPATSGPAARPTSSPATPAALAPPLATTPRVSSSQPQIASARAITGGMDLGQDLWSWQIWWDFNKHAYLDVRKREFGPVTGDGEILNGLDTARKRESLLRGALLADVVPILEGQLGEKTQSLQTAALISLSKIGADPSGLAKRLKPFLQESQQVSETATLAIGMLESPVALDLLTELLRDSKRGRQLVDREAGVPERTRAFAAYGLGFAASNNRHQAMRSYAAEQLLEGLFDDDSGPIDTQMACVLALGMLELDRPEPIADRLLKFFQDDRQDVLVRAHVPTTLAKLLAESTDVELRTRATEAIRHSLEDADSAEIRQSSAQALGLMADVAASNGTEIVEQLIHAASKDRNFQTRNFSLMALAYLGGRSGSQASIVEKEILPFLLRTMERGSTPQRPWAALSLGVLAAKGRQHKHSPLPRLIVRNVRRGFDNTRSAGPRAAYALALGLMQDTDSAGVLSKAMFDVRDPIFRGACAEALGLMDALDQGETLLTLLEESTQHPELMQQISHSLGILGEEGTVQTLAGLMEHRGGSSLAEVTAASTALGMVGDHQAVEPLLHVLGSKRFVPLARSYAAFALGTLARESGRPWSFKITSDLNYCAAVLSLTDPSGGTGVLNLL